MSTCKICAKNGKPNLEISFSDKVRSQYSRKMIPLETDGSTFHKHYGSTSLPLNGNGNHNNSITEQAQKDETSFAEKVKKEDTVDKTIPKVDSLNFAEILCEVLKDYVRLKRNEIGEPKR
jgi:ribosomal protein RSM22 (predicted rRNA methylase)